MNEDLLTLISTDKETASLTVPAVPGNIARRGVKINLLRQFRSTAEDTAAAVYIPALQEKMAACG
jgi:hypothetical protein